MKTCNRILLLIVLSISMVGCKSLSKRKSPALTITEIEHMAHNKAVSESGEYIREDLKELDGFGYTQPFIAMRQGEVIDKVYIPTQNLAEDIKFQGSWVHFVLYKNRWFDDVWYRDNEFEHGGEKFLPEVTEK